MSGVSKHYGNPERPVLRDLNLDIAAGERLVIIGRSGSGKSTLLNLLGALDRPSAGEIRYRGQRLDTLDESRLAAFRRREIGFVFQAFNLVPTLTVLENLLLPAELNGLPRRTAAARCQRLLAEAGLAELAARYPDELAGGEQQRVAVLRAVVHEPSVVIADEPTGNLDLDNARRTLDLLQAHSGDRGRSLVMATHSRQVIGRATRLLEIRDGRLVPAPC
ncbi:MAG: ABC transporter ATP-binding protein [Gammaproteobacteria bacterium]|nr:MAG: ABC transporter ATP-binding protein [Gammaproteobacteria bacterium]